MISLDIIAGVNHRGDSEAHGGEHQRGQHGGAGKEQEALHHSLKPISLLLDTNNNCENTAEPLQVGQREVDGEVLLG